MSRNGATIVGIPANATPPRRGKAMTAEQAEKFLLAAKGTPLEAIWVTMSTSGCGPARRPDCRRMTSTSTTESSTFAKLQARRSRLSHCWHHQHARRSGRLKE